MNRHEMIDQRSLAFGQAIAERLRENPALIEYARANILNWQKTCSPGVARTLGEWTRVLDSGLDDVFNLLTGWDERSIRPRQSNPFAGLLPQAERNAILRRFETYDKIVSIATS